MTMNLFFTVGKLYLLNETKCKLKFLPDCQSVTIPRYSHLTLYNKKTEITILKASE